MNGVDFFSRKGVYGIAGMVVCDDRKIIIYINIGFPGCAHDQRVYESSELYRDPDTHFGPDEYLIADSG